MKKILLIICLFFGFYTNINANYSLTWTTYDWVYYDMGMQDWQFFNSWKWIIWHSTNSANYYIYNLPIPYNLSWATFNFSWATWLASYAVSQMFFSSDGLTFFDFQSYSKTIRTFSLSSPFSLVWKTYLRSFTFPCSSSVRIFFSPLGDKVYHSCNSYPTWIQQYTFSTPWNTSTATWYTVLSTYPPLDPTWINVSPDWTDLYVSNYSSKIYRYTTTTPFNFSWATLIDSYQSPVNLSQRGFIFSWNMSKMYYQLDSSYRYFSHSTNTIYIPPPLETPNNIPTTDWQLPYIDICNFTNLDRADWLTCNNFNTNIETWTLNFNFTDPLGITFIFYKTLEYLRENNLIWFDKQLNFKNEMWDDYFWLLFNQTWTYNLDVTLDFLSYTGEYVQSATVLQSFEMPINISPPSNLSTNINNSLYINFTCDVNWDADIGIWEGLICPITFTVWIFEKIFDWIQTVYNFATKIINLSPDLSSIFFIKTYADTWEVQTIFENLSNKSPLLFPQMEVRKNFIKYWLFLIFIIMGLALILLKHKNHE